MKQGIFAYWPNRITALRFLGALALFVLFALRGDLQPEEIAEHRSTLLFAFWLFIATAVSDILDGWLARRGNQITTFGRIADPFVDKVLVLGAMIFLAVMPWSREYFPAWIVVVILAREFLVTGIRGYVETIGGTFPADWFGKVKMFTQCFAVGAVIGLHAFEWSESYLRIVSLVGKIFVIATLLTSLGSGLSYIIKTRQLLAERALNKLRLAIVSCGFLGCSPFAPGTVGTLGGVLIAWLLRESRLYLAWSLLTCAALYVVGRALGPWAERYAAERFGQGKDPGFFVLDEVIGYLITVAWLSGPTPIALVLGFFVFRFFDVFKPALARKLERLPGGDGILLDDVVSGAYGLVLVMLPARLLIDVPWSIGG